MVPNLKVFLLVTVVSSSLAADNVQQTKGGSVQKVIQMLGDMLAKAKMEKNTEEINFAEFGTWCTAEKASLAKSIKAEGEAIETHTNSIGKLGSDIKELGAEIGTLQTDLAKFDADHKAEVAQRKKDNDAFLAESQDFSESVDAIERAIAMLQKQSFDRKGSASALLQLSQSAQLPQNAKAMLQAFMGMMDTSEEGSPEANAYEFQSGSIIDMLKKLRDDFASKLGEAQKEEMNSKHASDMVVQDLTDSLENAKKDLGEKTIQKENKAESKARESKELQQAKARLSEDQTTLKDTKAECFEKKLSFEGKQDLRAEEIEAIQKAVEILSDPDAMSGVKHLSFVQVSSTGSSLAQFLNANAGSSASSTDSEGIRLKVKEFVAERAKKLHSKDLELLAQKLEADPFVKVKKMIESMITRLLNEANEDAQHEGFCDKEMGQSKITRNKLSEDIDGLSAAVDEGQAQIMLLKQDGSKLTAEVADLDASMMEATKLRNKEKAQNKEVVEDSKQAIGAVQAATAVLKDFYKAASTATALMQAKPKHEEGMQTFGDKFTGQQEEAGGVMALLEVILADFSNVKADTLAAEAVAAKSYDDFMTEAKRNKATKSKAIEMDESDKIAAEAKLQSDTNDLKSTQDQLLAANRYHDTLVPQCVDKGQTFDERAGSRREEIQSLKEALTILEGQ
jgi:hypothetical protein